MIKELLKEGRIDFLVNYLFGYELTGRQIEIVRKIALKEHNRISVSAMTRYGKTLCVAIGVAIYILFNPGKKIAFVAPKQDQAEILRNYMSELVLRNSMLLGMAEIQMNVGSQKLKKEASKKRLTFTNGCEYRVFSAEGEADRLMGFGADLVVKDEACLISDTANTKIMRMLGDDPENAILVELFNPWNRDNKSFEHTLQSNFDYIHIDWRQAVKEGRTTENYVMEQKKELTPLEFTVLYESKFPAEAEDSVFNLNKIQEAEDSFDLMEEFNTLKEKKEVIHKYTQGEAERIKRQLAKFELIIGCDVADKGLDETVILYGIRKGNSYQVVDYYSEPKSENMDVAGRINYSIKNWVGKNPAKVNIDSVGIGIGVASAVSEFCEDMGYENVEVVECNFGKKAEDEEKFVNRKAEEYFRLKDLFIEGMIAIPHIDKMQKQMLAVTWKPNSTSKIKIEDPEEKSPDWADALVYFVWEDEGLGMGFVSK